jgi:hypothetical protein
LANSLLHELARLVGSFHKYNWPQPNTGVLPTEDWAIDFHVSRGDALTCLIVWRAQSFVFAPEVGNHIVSFTIIQDEDDTEHRANPNTDCSPSFNRLKGFGAFDDPDVLFSSNT